MGRIFPAALSPAPEAPWWAHVNGPPIFYLLATLYGALAVTALVRLLIIQFRLPGSGWTAQKVFHLLNLLVTGTRSATFAFRHAVQLLKPAILHHLLLDETSLLFFTAYATLALFWAEVYNDANKRSNDGLKPRFYMINAAAYGVPMLLLWLQWPESSPEIFLGGVSLVIALGFVLHGGRLFLMLRSLPVESRGRRKKLGEVGILTAICFSCFLVRSVMLWLDAFCLADVFGDHVLSFLYYFLVEILPCGLAFLVLRKLPPKRGLITHYYRPVSSGQIQV